MSLAVSLSAGGEEAAATNRTVITADRLTFDYKRYIAVFEENVVAVDPRIEIESDKLTVIFDNTNDVKSVTAIGDVHLRTEDKTGVCRKAIYLARLGEVILLGDARLYRGKDSIMGDKITFWVNEDRMTCEPGRLIVVPEDEQAAEPATVPDGGQAESETDNRPEEQWEKDVILDESPATARDAW